jgi:hypothetical protein
VQRSKNISTDATIFSGSMRISNSEKGFSPELCRPVPQVDPKPRSCWAKAKALRLLPTPKREPALPVVAILPSLPSEQIPKRHALRSMGTGFDSVRS